MSASGEHSLKLEKAKYAVGGLQQGTFKWPKRWEKLLNPSGLGKIDERSAVEAAVEPEGVCGPGPGRGWSRSD